MPCPHCGHRVTEYETGTRIVGECRACGWKVTAGLRTGDFAVDGFDYHALFLQV